MAFAFSSRSGRPGLTGTQLKRIACVSMFIDHIGASCLESGLMACWPNPTGAVTFRALAAADPVFARLYWLDFALRMIGRLAFPIYCFLLAEGFVYTRSPLRYGARLAVFAAVSELPFNAAFFGGLRHPGYQNVYFTLLLGLCAMALLRRFDRGNGRLSLRQLAGVAACALAAQLLHTDYGAMGVALIAVFYQFRSQPARRDTLAIVLTVSELTAPLALLPIRAYNGQRGRCARWESYAFYAFYPVHLTALACVTHFWLR